MTAPILTASARDRVRAELERLLTVERPSLARATVSNEGVGDAADVADRVAAMMDLQRIDERVLSLQNLLAEAVDAPATDGGQVSAGTVVHLLFEGDDAEERFLVGTIEERHDDIEVVTLDSPLGRALMGARAGTGLRYQPSPGRPEVSVQVVSVEAA